MIVSGFSGNEMFCLAEKGWSPGNIVLGNSVQSLGFLGGIAARRALLLTSVGSYVGPPPERPPERQAEARRGAPFSRRGGERSPAPASARALGEEHRRVDDFRRDRALA